VIHAVHTNDMWQMGGLKTQMPMTAFTYLIGCLAIAGCPMFAGFYSKEAILGAAYAHNPVIFVILAISSFLTSFYMFRSWFLTFTGLPRDKERFQHAHESPWAMTMPLAILAFLSITLGFFFWYQGNLSHFISWGEAAAEEHEGGHLVMAASLVAFLSGLGGASWVYMSKPPLYDKLAAMFATPYRVLSRRYGFDEVYLWLIDKVYYPVMSWTAAFDYNVIDQTFVDGFGRVGRLFARISGFFDQNFVDRVLVDGTGDVAEKLGAFFRRLQSGIAQSYLFWMGIGLASMFVWIAYNFK
jgi:NADH-quinone oxidoreductase subunit L